MVKSNKQTCSQAHVDDTSESEDTSANTTSNSKLDKASELKKGQFEVRYSVTTSTPEEVLAKQQLTWTSDIYNHDKMPPEIKVEGNSVEYLFVCKMNPSKCVA
ncbi:hypothetical protein K439DRAFT_1610613 [Ramaria rubella]|nr:hypothetical protein K439DRAFT_1610613 [Ramaria rubella]